MLECTPVIRQSKACFLNVIKSRDTVFQFQKYFEILPDKLVLL